MHHQSLQSSDAREKKRLSSAVFEENSLEKMLFRSRRSIFYTSVLVVASLVLFLLMTSLMEQHQTADSATDRESQQLSVAALNQQREDEDDDDDDGGPSDLALSSPGGASRRKRRTNPPAAGRDDGILLGKSGGAGAGAGFLGYLKALSTEYGPCNLAMNLTEDDIIRFFVPPKFRPPRNNTALAAEAAKRMLIKPTNPPAEDVTLSPFLQNYQRETHKENSNNDAAGGGGGGAGGGGAALPFANVALDRKPRALGVAGEEAPEDALTQSPPVAAPAAAGDHKALRSERRRKGSVGREADEDYRRQRRKLLGQIHFDIKHNQHRCTLTRPYSTVPLYPLTISQYRGPFLLADVQTLYELDFSWPELVEFDFDSVFTTLMKVMAEAGNRQHRIVQEQPQQQVEKEDVVPASLKHTAAAAGGGGDVGNETTLLSDTEAAAAAAAADVPVSPKRPLTPSVDENMRIFFAWKFYNKHKEVPDEEQFAAWMKNLTTQVSFSGASSRGFHRAASLKFCDIALYDHMMRKDAAAAAAAAAGSAGDNNDGGRDNDDERRNKVANNAAAVGNDNHDDVAPDSTERLLRREYLQLQRRAAAASSRYVPPRQVARRWSLRPRHSFTVAVNRTRVWEHLIPDVRMAFPTEIERCHAVGARMLAILVSILEKQNLRIFFLTHGSLLGAYRNGGALPWDVDVDVAMPDSHLRHLRRVWRSEFPRDMFLQTENTEPGFQMYTARRIQVRIKDRYSCAYGVPSMISKGSTRMKLRKTHHGFGIDLIPLEKRSKGRQYKVLHHFFNTSDIFPLSAISFNGVLVPAPRRTKHVLQTLYGDDFATHVKHPPAHFGGADAFPLLATYSCPGSTWSLNWTAERRSSVADFAKSLLPEDSKESRGGGGYRQLRPWQQQVLHERTRHFEQCTLSPRDDPNNH